MTSRLAWVAPANPIGGEDPLGVQATSIALYSELLPGLTNATDRARYFTFHPWFVRAFERYSSDHSELMYARRLRAAECLMTLVAIRHRAVTGQSDEVHNEGTIGNQKLGVAYASLPQVGALPLDPYAAFADEDPAATSRGAGAAWGSTTWVRSSTSG